MDGYGNLSDEELFQLVCCKLVEQLRRTQTILEFMYSKLGR